MTPAEIIARELCHTRPKVEQRPGNYEMVVSTDFSPVVAAILNALQAAGIRLIPADEYDPVTIEAAAKVAERMLIYADTTSTADKEIAAAVRALADGGGSE